MKVQQFLHRWLSRIGLSPWRGVEATPVVGTVRGFDAFVGDMFYIPTDARNMIIDWTTPVHDGVLYRGKVLRGELVWRWQKEKWQAAPALSMDIGGISTMYMGNTIVE